MVEFLFACSPPFIFSASIMSNRIPYRSSLVAFCNAIKASHNASKTFRNLKKDLRNSKKQNNVIQVFLFYSRVLKGLSTYFHGITTVQTDI